MKVSRWIGSVVAVLFATQMGATELTIVPLTGAEQSTAIEDIGSLVFENENNATLYAVDRTVLAKYSLDDVRKLFFFFDGNGVDEVMNNRQFAIYPNPTTDELQVNGADERTQIHIVDLNGRVLQSVTGATINVGDLAVGVYTLVVDGEVFRFIKK